MPLETEPVTLKMNASGEVVVPWQFVSGVEAVNVGITTRLKLFAGEWFLDLEAGVPYWTDVLGQKFDDRKVRAAFRREILTCPGVAEIRSLEAAFDGATRELTVAWEVRCEFGADATGTTQIAA